MSQNLLPLVGSRIEAFDVLSGRYTRKPITGVEQATNQLITSLEVKGKLMALHLEDHTILSTAGMAGTWRQGQVDHKFSRVQLKAGKWATFVDMRNFGTFRVVSNQVGLGKLAELGPDIMETPLPPADIWPRIKKFGKNQRVAEALLDQRIFCGVGNYIRADAMWLASINPREHIKNLSETQVNTLWAKCHSVAVSAFELGQRYSFKVYAQPVSPSGKLVERFTDVNNRTVWWCPAEQV